MRLQCSRAVLSSPPTGACARHAHVEGAVAGAEGDAWWLVCWVLLMLAAAVHDCGRLERGWPCARAD